MHRGPLFPTLALASGIAASAVCGLRWWWSVVPLAIALSLYLYLLSAAKDPVAAFRLGKWHIVWVILLFFGIGIADESLSRPLPLEEAFNGHIPDRLRCEVTDVLTKTYGDRIDVRIEGTNGAKARIRTGVTEVASGDIILIPSSCLQAIASDTTETGRRIMPMMKAAGILYSGRTLPNRISVIGVKEGVGCFFADMREKIEMKIEGSRLKKPTADFLKAILMGDKTGLDEDTRLTFSYGGMAHMLALSGLHIGILAGFILALMWPVRLAGRYKWGYAMAIVLLWLYVAVTGMAYSSVRACIMTTFAFIGIMAERKNFAASALSSACLLIMIFDPAALFNAGFQLSVVCVGALIAFASRLNPIGHRHHPVLYCICGSLIATMVATTASWVLTSYYFSQIPLMFLPTNLVILPVLPFYLSLAVVFIGLRCLGLEMHWMCRLLDFGYEKILKCVESLSAGGEFVVDYQVPLWAVMLWLLLLGIGAYAINRKETI